MKIFRVLALMLLCCLFVACEESKPTPPAGNSSGTSNKSGNAQGGQQIKSLGEQ